MTKIPRGAAVSSVGLEKINAVIYNRTKDLIMDLNKFTEKAQFAIAEAQQVAARLGQQNVDVEHLLLALLTQENGLVPRLME
ncbi:MAG: hypothetical protein LBK60_09175, partial [Verrucomicrobiales bacterium]|nr:hypothetical protein [Verrucomicrobiales bacterium]